MTGIEHINNLLATWTPWLAVFGVASWMYKSASKKISTWANKLLNNHMEHLQGSLDRIDEAQKEQLDHLSVQTENLTAQTVLLQQIAQQLASDPRKQGKSRSGKIKN